MDNLSVQTPGPKYCHFPLRDDYGGAYFIGLLSEHLVYKAERKNPWVWEKIPGHERNEALDCRNYAMAAFKVLPKDLDRIDSQLKAMRGQQIREPTAVHTTPPRRSKKSSKQPSKGIGSYYDDW